MHQITIDEYVVGRKLADEGIETAAARHKEWVERAKSMALAHARIHGRVNSDDIHRICPPPHDAHRNIMGIVFRDKRFRMIGYAPTARPEGHARIIRVYEAALPCDAA
jgi:hypothetical protein